MSISIRLAKFGKKHAPAYKIVVANTKDKRNGKFLDILGHYNPSENPVKFEYDKDKYANWKSKGALVTDAVSGLVAGTYEQRPHDPHKKLIKEQEAAVKAVEDAKRAEEASAKEATPAKEEATVEETAAKVETPKEEAAPTPETVEETVAEAETTEEK